MYIVLAILAFGFLIFIHELGHYIAARIFHVRIFEFSIGMGPRLLSYTSKKTGIVYALRLLPFGGFVSMEGELVEETENGTETSAGTADGAVSDDPVAEDGFVRTDAAVGAKTPEVPDEQVNCGPLISRPAWQRLIVHAAGALMNLFFGFLAMFIITTQSTLTSTTIGEFRPTEETGYPVSSESYGLMVGDTILSVNGERVYTGEQLYYHILHEGGTEGEALTLRILRGEEEMTLSVVFPTVVISGQSYGEMDFRIYAISDPSVGDYIAHSFHKCGYMVEMIWDSLIDLITGRYTIEAVSGPVGTATVVGEAAKGGFLNFLYICAAISINLGIFNLLPFPALDGGHLLYTLIEMVSRRRLSPKWISRFDMAGLFLLLALMVIVTGKDIFTLIRS